MRNRQVPSANRAGFTLIEVLVAVVVAALFITTFVQMYIVQSRISSDMSSFDTADMLAYGNLRTFAYGKAPTWFTCTYSGGSPLPVTLMNSTDPVAGLQAPVTQTVIATAPYGCGGGVAAMGYPVKVVSTVTYGSEGRTVTHATYATY